MKVMTVTEARVVAFLISSRVAPIANPSPCNITFVDTTSSEKNHCYILLQYPLVTLTDG